MIQYITFNLLIGYILTLFVAPIKSSNISQVDILFYQMRTEADNSLVEAKCNNSLLNNFIFLSWVGCWAALGVGRARKFSCGWNLSRVRSVRLWYCSIIW